ncbi:unnamed protein product [Vitrella brassicaformis CCMP3155]|uniref:Uncharacterized protein n=2 Tax=Vitrella brassicaformis TaxID=1169539 RepID=A0A0G4FZZ0_VITBC|nr:unnamed protein product [Vitrella brassicaformis CCMP3155]|eukprot:CEM20971.1 unnamed protein product [Vitrella brassicaformis CCMP3155]
MGTATDGYKLCVSEGSVFTISRQDAPLLMITNDSMVQIAAPELLVESLDVTRGLLVQGVPQWRMLSEESFADGTAEGWDANAVTHCAGTSMLGGYGEFAQKEVSKVFSGLPPHSHLRIKATFHFIDDWVGESGYMKANIGSEGGMTFVWTERHTQAETVNGVNLCGDVTASEGKFAVPVDVVLPHNQPTVALAFGSTITQNNPLHHSWGVSAIEIYVR